MLSKEECQKALGYLSNYNGEEFNGEKFANAIEDLHRLINEHFNNSFDFKAFKLPSDSTLKSLKKDELIEYIHMVYHNWRCADSYYENTVNYNYKLSKENEELKNQLVEIESILSRVSTRENSNPPLKFEDLKPGMWIWDNKKKEYVKCSPNKNALGERCVWFWWSDFNPDGEYEEDYLIFEENRFYLREVKE